MKNFITLIPTWEAANDSAISIVEDQRGKNAETGKDENEIYY